MTTRMHPLFVELFINNLRGGCGVYVDDPGGHNTDPKTPDSRTNNRHQF